MSNTESGESKAIIYKIILIGDSSVGKTDLFKKLAKGNFRSKNVLTIGMDCISISFRIPVKEQNGTKMEKNFEIQLWDTAGEERFRSISKCYYKESQGLLLMYDITNKDSFDNLYPWINRIRDNLGNEKENNNYIIILLGNKLDLINEYPEMRKVEEDDAKNICKEFNLIWGGECSVKDLTPEEFEDKFKEYTKEIYKLIGNNIIRWQRTKINGSAKRRSRVFC